MRQHLRAVNEHQVRPLHLVFSRPSASTNATMASPYSGTINYTNSDGRRLWAMAITPAVTPYDGSASGANKFLADVHNRVMMCCWEELITFQHGTGTAAKNYNLLDHASLVPLEVIKQRAEEYKTVDKVQAGVGQGVAFPL